MLLLFITSCKVSPFVKGEPVDAGRYAIGSPIRQGCESILQIFLMSPFLEDFPLVPFHNVLVYFAYI